MWKKSIYIHNKRIPAAPRFECLYANEIFEPIASDAYMPSSQKRLNKYRFDGTVILESGTNNNNVLLLKNTASGKKLWDVSDWGRTLNEVGDVKHWK